MTSSRLPGKVMLPAAGSPMLLHLIKRLKQVQSLDDIVLATTTNPPDDVLIEFAKRERIFFFRGSENDVMERVVGAADSVDADLVVEITADCPVIDPQIVEQLIQMFLHNDCDYASNAIVRSYPIGMDTQVFPSAVLKRSLTMTKHPLDREHVTRHIRQNPDLFRQVHLVAPPDLYWPELALTLDEKQDYELLKLIIEYFGDRKPCFACGDIVRLLKNTHPEWISINREVQRKGLN